MQKHSQVYLASVDQHDLKAHKSDEKTAAAAIGPDEPFSLAGFQERMTKWIVADDQVGFPCIFSRPADIYPCKSQLM